MVQGGGIEISYTWKEGEKLKKKKVETAQILQTDFTYVYSLHIYNTQFTFLLPKIRPGVTHQSVWSSI